MADPPPVPDRIACRIRAEERAVRRILGRVTGHYSSAISPEDWGMVELALAEVLNNVVEHAYARRRPGPVRLELTRRSDAIDCRIEDEGWPMPDLALPDGRMQPVYECIEDLPEGGWGWALIRSLTTNLSYERDGSTNRLTFRIPLAQAG